MCLDSVDKCVKFDHHTHDQDYPLQLTFERKDKVTKPVEILLKAGTETIKTYTVDPKCEFIIMVFYKV